MFEQNYKNFADSKLINYSLVKYNERNEVDNPKVSIIVPVYNAGEYIQRCMHYLVMQSVKDIEIIVVNDGSTDNSMEYVQKLSKIDKRIKIINQENKLQGSARNNGLNHAKGEYIGFCDADDFVDYEYYETLYNTAKKYNSDIALAEYVRVGTNKFKPRLNIDLEAVYENIIDKINICKQNKNECPTNKIYRTDFLRKNHILFPEAMYCEDKLFSIKAVYYADKISTAPNVRYYYWENPNSTVNSKKTIKHIKDKIKAKQDVLAFVKEKNIPVENWYFKAEKKRYGLFRFPFIIVKQSTESEKIFLFGIIPLYEKCY